MKKLSFIASFWLSIFSGIASAQDDAYVLGAGDTVSIQVFDENELSGTFTIGEDGSIDYPLLGRLSVSGQTTDALDETLTAHLGTKYLRDPQIQVSVDNFGSHPVQVLGAVKTEFGKFGDVLAKTKAQLETVTRSIEAAQTRTRVMNRKLREVEALPGEEASGLLGEALPGAETDEP